ncbi:MAG: ABC transporter permease [Bacilli bacterium]|nr:ABC transporter permease [Bacilli bacterium]
MVKKILSYCYIYLILLFIYLPVFYLIIYSFTAADTLGMWSGFDLKLYADLFTNKETMIALGNTLILAVVASLVSTVIGTLGAIGLFYMKKGLRSFFENVNQIPVVNAEIVIAMSLTVMFVFVGQKIFGGANLFSFWTLLIGHCALAIPFVYLNVKPKLTQMDPALYEAALDLGSTPTKAIHQVIIPQIVPGIFSGLLLSFTLSLDDFIVTAFTRGSGLLSGHSQIETLSTLVQTKIKKGSLPPEMRALTTIIFLVVLTIVVIYSLKVNHDAKKAKSSLAGAHAKKRSSFSKEAR